MDGSKVSYFTVHIEKITGDETPLTLRVAVRFYLERGIKLHGPPHQLMEGTE
jgi:hypothetical protein